MINLEHLRPLRKAITRGRLAFYRRVYGMDVHPTVELSLTARLDRRYPKGIVVGERCYLALDCMILSHDFTRGIYRQTVIEPNCFLGARSLIMPGVRVGTGSIVGAGAVVTADVPPFSAVAGNPATVIKRDIDTGPYGRLRSADDPQSATAAAPASSSVPERPGV